jgi:hypothetical protein
VRADELPLTDAELDVATSSGRVLHETESATTRTTPIEMSLRTEEYLDLRSIERTGGLD